MTNDQDSNQLTEARKGAVVHACPECAASQGWDLSRPLEELEIATGTRAESVFAEHADEWTANGYGRVQMTPCAASDSGIRLICPHLAWNELVAVMEMRRKFLAEGLEG